MKTIILCVLFFIFISENVSAQSSTFDSAYVLISSNVYDYKNPTFENKFDPFNISSSGRYVYEVHSGPQSNLIMKKFTFSSEDSAIQITSDNFKNTNASFSAYMIVWESNKYGKQDLFYSLYNGVTWSAPAIIDTTPGDKTHANIHFSGYNDIYSLSYQKNDDIYLKNYINGVWLADTNLTSSINDSCHTPVLSGSNSLMSVLFIQELSDSTNKVKSQSLRVQYPLYNFLYYPQTDIYLGKKVKNIYLSIGSGENFLNFERDSSGQSDVFGYQFFQGLISSYTSQFSGNCFNGRGSFAAGVFANNTEQNYFFCFGFVRKDNDTTTVVAYRTKNSGSLITRKFYIGDSSALTYCNISRPVGYFLSSFRIRLIWEKMLNGKTALYESDLIDIITNVSENVSPANNFSLSQNYPNPFNPKTKLEFGISKLGFVTLKVFNMLGKEVATLVNEKLNPGNYSVDFNGEGLPSGVYFYKLVVSSSNSLETSDFFETKRMVLLK